MSPIIDLVDFFDRDLLTAAVYEDLNPRLQEIKRKLKLWDDHLYKRDRGRVER